MTNDMCGIETTNALAAVGWRAARHRRCRTTTRLRALAHRVPPFQGGVILGGTLSQGVALGCSVAAPLARPTTTPPVVRLARTIAQANGSPISSPKGLNSLAQGNALGTRPPQHPSSPKGLSSSAQGNALGTRPPQHPSSPKGLSSSAQGNALGTRPPQHPSSPKGLSSSAQGNALGTRPPRHSPALKGRDQELALRRTCEGDNGLGRTLPFRLVMADKRTNSEGLQIADMVARPVALSVLRPCQPNRAMAILEGKLWRGPDGRAEGYGLKCFPEKNEGPPGSPSGPPPNGYFHSKAGK